jgi:hypothetical protein
LCGNEGFFNSFGLKKLPIENLREIADIDNFLSYHQIPESSQEQESTSILIGFIEFLTQRYSDMDHPDYSHHPISIMGKPQITFERRRFIFVMQQLLNKDALMGLITQKKMPKDINSHEAQTLVMMENSLL